jgi:cyclopropane fatty-acyl-phospholipid synthase-like methyltransferase
MSLNSGWHELWNKRGSKELDNPTLQDLIALDGFDSGAGKVDEDDWRAYASLIVEKLGIKNGDSILEVGCGAGAFISALKQHRDISISGIDYSESLISIAKKALPEANLKVAEAVNINLEKKYDFILSNAVFHYFKKDYAETVIVKMAKIMKTEGAILILDVPNMETRDFLEKTRQDKLNRAEYEKKYKNYKHTYYQKEWFTELASRLNLQYEIFNSFIPNYAQAQYRFCVLLRRENR